MLRRCRDHAVVRGLLRGRWSPGNGMLRRRATGDIRCGSGTHNLGLQSLGSLLAHHQPIILKQGSDPSRRHGCPLLVKPIESINELRILHRPQNAAASDRTYLSVPASVMLAELCCGCAVAVLPSVPLPSAVGANPRKPTSSALYSTKFSNDRTDHKLPDQVHGVEPFGDCEGPTGARDKHGQG